MPVHTSRCLTQVLLPARRWSSRMQTQCAVAAHTGPDMLLLSRRPYCCLRLRRAAVASRHAASSAQSLPEHPECHVTAQQPLPPLPLPGSVATSSHHHYQPAPLQPQALVVQEARPEVLSPASNYENIVSIGAYKASLPAAKIFVLGIMAGCYIAFGGLLMFTLSGNMPGLAASNYGLYKLLAAMVFPVGLLMVMLGGAELYTGNTFTVACAYLEGKVRLQDLAKSWLCSYSGNLVGCLLMVAAVSYINILAGNPMPAKMAAYKTSHALGPCIVRAILANWLVNVAVFHCLAASSLPGKLLGLWPPITAFVTIGLEHSVANMFIIPLGITMGAQVTWSHFIGSNLIPVTVGNTIAGAVCMALMYCYAYGSIGKQLFKPVGKH